MAGAIRFLPGFGEAFLPMRIKVAFTLTISALIYPFVQELLPVTEQPILLFKNIVKETFIGIFVGLTFKLIFLSIQTAGVIIATQSGVAYATMLDPTQKEQTTILTSLLSFFLLASIFVSDTHHLFIRTIIETYHIIEPKDILAISDFSSSIVNTISLSLQLALKISAPFLIINLIITICNGILSRLMPSFQVFFVMTPLQVLITYIILMITINSTLTISIDSLKHGLFNIK